MKCSTCGKFIEYGSTMVSHSNDNGPFCSIACCDAVNNAEPSQLDRIEEALKGIDEMVRGYQKENESFENVAGDTYKLADRIEDKLDRLAGILKLTTDSVPHPTGQQELADNTVERKYTGLGPFLEPVGEPDGPPIPIDLTKIKG